MSINRLYETGKRSLLTHQSAMNTVSSNIANANTEGYTRKRLNMVGLNIGLSRELQLFKENREEDVLLVRRGMVDQLLWRENQAMGRFETSQRMFSQIESIYGDATDSGLSSMFPEFWDAWSELANDPESLSLRSIVKDKGTMISNMFQRVHQNLSAQQRHIDLEIGTQVGSINQMVNEIATINRKIVKEYSTDLINQRNSLITELSKKINIEISEGENEQVNIFTDGLLMVSGVESFQLSIQKSTEDGELKTRLKVGNIEKMPSTHGGEISGLLHARNDILPEHINNLNLMARRFAGRVNQIHRNGVNLDGLTGVDFFSKDVSGALDLTVNPTVAGNSNLIATRPDGKGVGNGDIAQAISDVQYEGLVEEKQISEFYVSMLSRLGNQVQENELQLKTQQTIVLQVRNQRESISGVSLDEEMTFLVQYEQAYQAALRVIKTADEMMETLLNMS